MSPKRWQPKPRLPWPRTRTKAERLYQLEIDQARFLFAQGALSKLAAKAKEAK
jgi:hypothetical protein